MQYREISPKNSKIKKTSTKTLRICCFILIIISIALLLFISVSDRSDSFRIVCYYKFPHENETNPLNVEEIDPFLCTHLIAFASLRDNSLYFSDLTNLNKLLHLKIINTNLKVLLSVGSDAFHDVVINFENRKKFIKSVLYYVKLGIDGVDLDWEFPNSVPHGDKFQKQHFTELLAEIRQENKFLLSVAVAAPAIIVDNSYEVALMSKYVDFVNIMCYDYHFYTKSTPFTGFNSPLYPSANEKYYLATLNLNYSANYWLSKGMDANKINLGLPTYGHTFKLTNLRNNGNYAPARDIGSLGTAGFIDYAEICIFIIENQIVPNYDLSSKSPYAVKDFEWISYDDELSLSFKAEYIRENAFGGVMIYSLNSDDHQPRCRIHKEKFPLVNIVKNVLLN